jgi:hypothetical protein
MPVEHLAIVEGPMNGLSDNGNGEAGASLERAKKWMVEHGVRPTWLIGGAVVGGFSGDSVVKGAALGAAIAGGLSYMCTMTCRAEQPTLVGVVPMGQIEKANVEQFGIGQIEPAKVQQLGAIEWTPANVVGVVAALAIGGYLIFGRG